MSADVIHIDIIDCCRDVAKRKRWGVQENFFQNFRCIEKFFGREEGIYKTFKSWGGVQNLIFPSDDLFFK